MVNAVRIVTVTTGSIHQRSLRRVGLSGPPLVPPMATGVPGASSTVVVTSDLLSAHTGGPWRANHSIPMAPDRNLGMRRPSHLTLDTLRQRRPGHRRHEID